MTKLSKIIGKTSGASRSNICKFSEVLGLRSKEKVISKGDDFVLDAHFYFEPVQITGVICSVLWVPVTARAREFCSTWSRDICFCVKLR